MDLILQRPLNILDQLRRQRLILKVETTKEILDEIVSYLHTTNNRVDGLHRLSAVCQEFSSVYMLIPFDNLEIIKHEFFIIIGRTFEMLLAKARLMTMSKEDEQHFYELSYFIVNLCFHKNTEIENFYIGNNEKLNYYDDEEGFNSMSYQRIFLTKSFFERFIKLVTDNLIINDYPPFHVKYKVAHRLLHLCTELDNIDHNVLIDPIIECLKSNFYLDTFKTVDLRQPNYNPKQLFFISECAEFLSRRCWKRRTDISKMLCAPMLEFSRDIFKQHLPILLEGENLDSNNEYLMKGAKIQAVILHIKLLNYFALEPTARKYFYRESVYANQQLFHADVGLVSYAITLLYNLVFEKKIFYLLRQDMRVLNACSELERAKDLTIQFGSQTLLAILNQKEIDQINNPSEIVQNYLHYIENMIDEPEHTYHGVRLNGVLTNLESCRRVVIVQNDEVKEEITNDDRGIPVLARCVYDKRQEDEIQQTAARILLSVSFIGQNAVDKIVDNEPLMSCVHRESKSNNMKQRGTNEGLLWKTGEEDKFILRQEEKKQKEQLMIQEITPSDVIFEESKAIYQYVRGDYRFNLGDTAISDIYVMISYCEDDIEICQRIYDTLKTSTPYHLAMDKYNMYSASPAVVASIAEKADVVVMCLSNKYRLSTVCRLAAEYIKKRQRPIIPVIVEANYKPTGWLNIAVGVRRFIDFTNDDLGVTYNDLIREIADIKSNKN
ncbi:unnamed protein product [Rotaria socialis]|uniref:TIR domain-containing protein n=1 Tax=Rotaria socialis TaxID=392032 RepID=A0A819YMR7_9BILA|nr:unnamed protein product [Rotaria socialis]CAF4244965.1 unnamed protein product [Rotaria socialis]